MEAQLQPPVAAVVALKAGEFAKSRLSTLPDPLRRRLAWTMAVDTLSALHAVAAANPNLVVVLVNGSTVVLGDVVPHARALVEAWLGGQAAGGARLAGAGVLHLLGLVEHESAPLDGGEVLEVAGQQ